MIRSLLWKEWREHRWKMLGLFAIYAALFGIYRCVVGLELAWQDEDYAVEILLWITCIIPGFIAMGTLSEERVSRTLDTLRVLPVRLPLAFTIKWLFGVATVIAPLMAAEYFAWQVLFADFKHLSGWTFPTLCYATVFAGGSLYAWTVALGIGCRSDMRVALVAMGVLAGSFILNVMVTMSGHPLGAWHWDSVLPTGLLLSAGALNVTRAWSVALLELGIAVGLLAWSSAWYGRAKHAFSKSSRVMAAPRFGKSEPRSFPVLWKTYRELAVICGGFLVIAFPLSMTGLAVLGGLLNYVLALIVGTHLGMCDLQPQVAGYWLTLPLDKRGYFWKRYALGGVSVLLCTVPLLVGMLRLLDGKSGSFSGLLLAMSMPVCCGYAAGVLSAGLLRTRVPAMILALGMQILLMLLVYFGMLFLLGRDSDLLTSSSWALLMVYGVLLSVVVLGAGWLAQHVYVRPERARVSFA